MHHHVLGQPDVFKAKLICELDLLERARVKRRR
jgi:hypothetical protein